MGDTYSWYAGRRPLSPRGQHAMVRCPCVSPLTARDTPVWGQTLHGDRGALCGARPQTRGHSEGRRTALKRGGQRRGLHSSEGHREKQRFLLTFIPSQNRSSLLSEYTK